MDFFSAFPNPRGFFPCNLSCKFIEWIKIGGGCILTAITTNNDLFILSTTHTRENLKHLRQTLKFFCPQCKGELQLRVGDIVIPHFAHKKDANCLQLFSDGESKDHLEGKQQLYHFFETKGLSVQLEPFIKDLSQRPDLLVTTQNEQYAIEFQCSNIPIEMVQARTKGYMNAKIVPIWLLKTPNFKQQKSTSIQLIQLSPFRQQFITRHSQHGTTLLTYNPTTAMFMYYSHLLFIQGYSFIAKVQQLPIAHQHFPFLQLKEPTKEEFGLYWQVHLHIRNRFLRQRFYLSRKGVQDLLLKGCYSARMGLEQLPLFIGLPVRNAQYIDVYILEWQASFFFFLQDCQKSILQVDDELISIFMKNNQFYFHDERGKEAILHYISLLKKLHIHSIHSSTKEAEILQLLHNEFLAKCYEN
ncbi:competence protein CoiA [Viridibacillus sp. NPDC096237]|uniref:competence protein CoiA n=1 Tax=Viridibacillus sp. NPDC096237 TaxID=3390721 RepID=UPI003CFD98CE